MKSTLVGSPRCDLGWSSLGSFVEGSTRAMLALTGLLALSFSATLRPVAPPAARANILLMSDEPAVVEPEAEEPVAAAAPAAPKRMNLAEKTKDQRQDGAGFNQFDPVLSLSRFVSRRFGLAGGLGFVAL